ncbi:tissue factor pathway inhibitor a [Amia ocellicauda]|uniref:tissue factor pathway inhibitor a n=1 Tax=Amia ocellicauda TaxID=2972642 RepID=UPI003464D4B9
MAQCSLWEVVMVCILHLSSCNSEMSMSAADGELPELKIFHQSCALKMDDGPCKANLPRFYFDIETHKCEPFDYGGCGGNANNFESLGRCEEMCVVKKDKNPCHLEEEPGPCRGIVIRYFFNNATQQCERLLYGGCFGNANNFKTLRECQDTCHKQKSGKAEVIEKRTESEPMFPVISADFVTLTNSSRPHASKYMDSDKPDFCLSCADRGTCDGSVKRYLYNPKTNRCQAFVYSGCGGNQNNFTSKKDCRKTCMKGAHVTRGKIRIKKKNVNILVKP